ncbi:MAG: AraC family transcriptional regulator [Thermoanaerobaculia bacterium]|nr:AraC family transcriptional regulator [Thermoanaerobaculia bacterium]
MPKPTRGSRQTRPIETRRWLDGDDGLNYLRATYDVHRFSYHCHDHFVIATNLSGVSACFSGPDRQLTFGPGEIAVIMPGEKHGGRRATGAPWVYRAVYPSIQMLRRLEIDLTGRPSKGPSFRHKVYSDPELARDFLIAHGASCGGDDALHSESLMVEVLGRLLKRYGTSSVRAEVPSDAARLSRGVDLLESSLAGSVSLQELADASGYSRFHFLRLFKRKYGETPHAYLTRRRVEHAQELLRRGLPIASVACDTGFFDQAHLTRRFKQIVGVTPGEFVHGVSS